MDADDEQDACLSASAKTGEINASLGVEPNTKHVDAKISLDTYIPLGCLAVALLDPSEHLPPDTPLPEVVIEVPPTNLSTSLQNSLESLRRSGVLRIFRVILEENTSREIWQLYLLPNDSARNTIDRTKLIKKQLEEILAAIDVSPSAWNNLMSNDKVCFQQWPSADFTSLFYLFNTLPSPQPKSDAISDRFPDVYSKEALESLLAGTVPGLETILYPYQKRSAAEMLRREVAPRRKLDPRLEMRTAPNGQIYYYNGRERTFLRHPQYFDSVRGGILAETMGLGKTLICITIILATKSHWPSVPPQYDVNRTPIRPSVASLSEMAAATIARYPIPWRKHFETINEEQGYEMTSCIRALEKERPSYELPPLLIRQQRNTAITHPAETIRLCSTTIVVVPKNLVYQWKSELAKHVTQGALRVLVMETKNKMLPSPDELPSFDVILFSRQRFEDENKSGEVYYESPLKRFHFLRIIIDEGHNISNGSTRAATVAESIIRAERRWVVSGTPAKDLMGVEVELGSLTKAGSQESIDAFRKYSLEQRKAFNSYQEDSSGAIKALGQLASRFLKVQPWTAPNLHAGNADSAKWEDYVYSHASLTGRTNSGFSHCLRTTLEGLVVKTRPEDVERDISLPPLTHVITRLEPSFYDKITANLFVLLILSNAITSERQDMDYLFHKSSQAHLHRLIDSLRQSAFYWVGLGEESVRFSLEATNKYLNKDNTKCSEDDRRLLVETAESAKIALESPVWTAVTRAQEMGVFIRDWPAESISAWAFACCDTPMVTGLTHCFDAQTYVNKRLSMEQPLEGFDNVARRTNDAIEAENAEVRRLERKANGNSNAYEAVGVTETPKSSDTGHLLASDITTTMHTPKKASRIKASVASKNGIEPQEASPKSKKRRKSEENVNLELTPDSVLGRATMTGTLSAKFSYLIDRILDIYKEEKCLVFYDGNYVAYYFALVLDILNIKHLIYSNDISNEQKGKYLVLFDEDPKQRVMLMDIKQAAHGLNICAASRVFFVNPVCRPNIEAQAIKRAHRIGQTRPVHVETLILKGTVEEAMYERALRMTSHEHLQAKTLEDDLGVARLIQSARVLAIKPEEMVGDGPIAKLAIPQQIFGRPGRGRAIDSALEKDAFGGDDDLNADKKQSVPRKDAAGRSSKKGKMVVIKEEPIE